jgi:hypothetical protein
MTSKYGPPAQPDTVDQLPPNLRAAALDYSALNITNGTGAWIGGVVIAAGYGTPLAPRPVRHWPQEGLSS